MISINGIDYLKAIAEVEKDTIPGGVLYLLVEGDTFTWRKASNAFDLDLFKVGEKINSTSVIGRAIKEKRVITQNVPRSLYGMRLKTVAIPLVNDNGEAVGGYSMVFPRLHPVAKSFSDFAPILVEMFPEGAFLYITDLQKIAYRQPSKKFDMSSRQVGYTLSEEDIATKVIKSKQPIASELNASKYGVPVLVSTYPLFDEEDPNEIVATLGIVTPKQIAGNLRDMSGNLQSGLSGIASAIEQLAASSSQIHTNEQALSNEIKEIIKVSEEINEVSTFIKKIADETKMLGLNAAIEASRAGDAGRGFGVVAEQIKRLSAQSNGTVPQIKKLTDSIKEKVEETNKLSQITLASSQEQAAATEEITANIEEITSTSEELNRIAKML